MSSQEPEEGNGGLQKVVLRHKCGAIVEIYLVGATVTSYRTPVKGQEGEYKEHIFCSPGAKFETGKAIRGGVPLVFPQFGQPDKAMPQHGFARQSMWTLSEVKDSDEESHAVFTLSNESELIPAECKDAWSNYFQLVYFVSLKEEGLKLTLSALNTSTEEKSFDFNFLLHTYLQVADIKDITVCGLKGLKLIDKVPGGVLPSPEPRDEVNLLSFTDSIYIGDAPEVKELTVKGADAPCFRILCEASIFEGESKLETRPCDVVVWNPYEKSPADIPEEVRKNFVCVEPGLVAEMHKLQPRQRADLSQTIIPLVL